jgi:hypothetical protein
VCLYRTWRNTDETYEMKSITGNAVNLSIAEVRLHRVLPADTVIHAHVGKKGEGMGRVIGNADSACGILMAVLVNSCGLGFVYVCARGLTRGRTHAFIHCISMVRLGKSYGEYMIGHLPAGARVICVARY